MLVHWKESQYERDTPPLVTVSRTSIRFPLFIGNGRDTKYSNLLHTLRETSIVLAEVVVIVVVVVVEVEFGTVGIETSVSWEQLWLLCQNFTLFCCTVQTTPRNLLAGIANNITSNTIQGRSDSFSNKLQRYLCSTEYSFKSFNPKKMGRVYSIMKSQSFDRCDSFGSLFLAPKHLYTYLVD